MNKELSKKELLQQKELLESFAETIPPIIFGNLIERDWKLAKQCVEIAKEYAEDENEKLRKENKELKEEIERLTKICNECFEKIHNKAVEISQLKASKLNKSNY